MDGRMSTKTARGYKFDVTGNTVAISSFKAMKKVEFELVDGKVPAGALEAAMRELRAFDAMKNACHENIISTGSHPQGIVS